MTDSDIKQAIEAAGYLPTAQMQKRVRELLVSQLTPALVGRAHGQLKKEARPASQNEQR